MFHSLISSADPRTRRRALSVAFAGVVLLSAAACGDDEGSSQGAPSVAPTTSNPASPNGTPSQTPSATAAPTSASPTPSPTPTMTEFRFTVTAGEVSGDTGKVSAAVGEPFLVTVASDEADEIHVHSETRAGFTMDIPAGGSATVEATITVAGIYEIELHDSGLQLARVEVT